MGTKPGLRVVVHTESGETYRTGFLDSDAADWFCENLKTDPLIQIKYEGTPPVLTVEGIIGFYKRAVDPEEREIKAVPGSGDTYLEWVNCCSSSILKGL